jgi:cytidylate kinase
MTLSLELDQDDIQLLQAALYEYINARLRPRVEDYVATRYAGDEYGDEWRTQKVKSVASNIERANTIRKLLFAK